MEFEHYRNSQMADHYAECISSNLDLATLYTLSNVRKVTLLRYAIRFAYLAEHFHPSYHANA